MSEGKISRPGLESAIPLKSFGTVDMKSILKDFGVPEGTSHVTFTATHYPARTDRTGSRFDVTLSLRRTGRGTVLNHRSGSKTYDVGTEFKHANYRDSHYLLTGYSKPSRRKLFELTGTYGMVRRTGFKRGISRPRDRGPRK